METTRVPEVAGEPRPKGRGVAAARACGAQTHIHTHAHARTHTREMTTRSGNSYVSNRRDTKRRVVSLATGREMPAFLFDLLNKDEQSLVWDLVVGRVAWMRVRMDEAVGTKDAHMAIGAWKKQHKKEHPLCVARLICKSSAESLRALVLMECRINSVFRIKKGVVTRRKSEEVFVDAFMHAYLYPFSGKGAKLTTKEFRAEWSEYLLNVLEIRVADAVTHKNDGNATTLYAALKNCIHHYLGDWRPGTGCARKPCVRDRIAMLLARLARPVDMRGAVQLRPNQRLRRPLTELIHTALAHA